METIITSAVGCWRLVKESVSEPVSENETLQDIDTTPFNDTYDYFPDFGI